MRIKVKGPLLLLQVDKKTAFVFLGLTTIPFCGVLTFAILARELGFKDFSDFSARFGSGWAYHLAPVIKDVGLLRTVSSHQWSNYGSFYR